MDSPGTHDYRALIKSFLNGDISAGEFERRFLRMFKTQGQPLAEEEFLVLDVLFGDVDAYCPDPELRDPMDLDEQQLLESAEVALHRLDSLLVR